MGSTMFACTGISMKRPNSIQHDLIEIGHGSTRWPWIPANDVVQTLTVIVPHIVYLLAEHLEPVRLEPWPGRSDNTVYLVKLALCGRSIL